MIKWLLIGWLGCRFGISSYAQSPKSFAYVLQADALATSKAEAVKKLADCDRDWLILDADYSRNHRWTTNDLEQIRSARPGRKIVAYLSIGEAEDYRGYWHQDWDANRDGKPDKGGPPFLLAQNPEWKGNYRVMYWQSEWQKIILAEVDQIMASGFDGVYLDIVDGFETFEKGTDNRINPETRQSYRRDMVDWVRTVAARARKINPAALVIPQNGTELLGEPDFLSTVDAVGVEDLFTNGDKEQNRNDTDAVLKSLAPSAATQKPVLEVEYPKRPDLRLKVKAEAVKHHFILLTTDRQLTTLGESAP